MPPRKIAVIANARAVGARGLAAASLAERFAARGLAAEVTVAQDGDELARAARQALGRGVETVVAGGGDGTMNAVAAHLVGTAATLGVLPLGTLNHFARDLRIPCGLDAAIRCVADGQAMRVDVGRVNDRVFLNNSSIGLYPAMVELRDRRQHERGWGKWQATVWASLQTLRSYPYVKVDVELDGTPRHRRTPFVFVGNNSYHLNGTGLDLGTRERLDGGELSLYLAPRSGRADVLLLPLQAWLGRLHRSRTFEAHRATQLRVDAPVPRLRVATDGETCLLETPLHYRIEPQALRVLAPPREP
jgi:diacylglycerol kinase family enzyme